MKYLIPLLAGFFAILLATNIYADEHHVTAKLIPIGDSGITGNVQVTQLPGGGTNITVAAKGLVPGVDYLSLYYENHTCALEEYAEDDIIGTYTANAAGVGTAHGRQADDLDEINSISVRLFDSNDPLGVGELQACADTHPGS